MRPLIWLGLCGLLLGLPACDAPEPKQEEAKESWTPRMTPR